MKKLLNYLFNRPPEKGLLYINRHGEICCDDKQGRSFRFNIMTTNSEGKVVLRYSSKPNLI